jgi:hypothetical protein
MHEANVEILLSWPLERNAVADRNLPGLGAGYLPNVFSFDFGQPADVQIHHLSDFTVAKDHVPKVIDCRTAPYRDRPCNRITSSLVSVPAEIKGVEDCDRVRSASKNTHLTERPSPNPPLVESCPLPSAFPTGGSQSLEIRMSDEHLISPSSHSALPTPFQGLID